MTRLLVHALFVVFVLAALAAGRWVAGRIVGRYGPQRVSGLPLAAFRIAYSVVLLCEIGQLFAVAPLVGEELNGLPFPLAGQRAALVVWMIAVACIAAGYRTRLAAVVSYAFTLLTLSRFQDFEYHVDYVFTMGNAFLLLAPVSARLSVDRLRSRVPGPGTVSLAWPVALVLVTIGFVYADSVFYKLAAPLWTGGLGLWLPASLPQATWYDLSVLLDIEWLARALGYVTFVFEAVFLVAVWWRRTWVPLVVVGAGLHAGILVAFPLPWFGLALLALYLVLLPAGFFSRLARVPPDAAPEPVSTGEQRALRMLPIFLTVAIGLQVVSTSDNPVTGALVAKTPAANGWAQWGRNVHWVRTHISRPLFGITSHAVFVGAHFEGERQIVSLVHEAEDGTRTPFPIVREDGLAHPLTSGRLWVHWNFRVLTYRDRPDVYTERLARVAEHWAHHEGVDLADGRVVLLAKDLTVVPRWEAGALSRRRALPWRRVGALTFVNGVPTLAPLD